MAGESPRVVALTGTPGTGKSTVAAALVPHGFDVVDLTAFVLDHDVLTTPDPDRDTRVVDHDDVNRALEPRILEARDAERPLVLEGHWAHDLDDVDLVVVLRLHPGVVEERLRARGWSAAKVQENAEAEAVGVIAAEVAEGPHPALEVDTTDLSVQEVVEAVLAGLRHPGSRSRPGTVDWIQRAPEWFG